MVEEVSTENYVEEEIRLSQKLAVNCFFKVFFHMKILPKLAVLSI